jgi:hypothetical protein
MELTVALQRICTNQCISLQILALVGVQDGSVRFCLEANRRESRGKFASFRVGLPGPGFAVKQFFHFAITPLRQNLPA